MKILHLNTSDLEGGAARAAYRLHQGLQQIGVSSQMLVRAKASADAAVVAERSLLTKMAPRLNEVPLRFYPKRDRLMFSPQWVPDAIAPAVAKLNPDLILVHWVCNGFLQIDSIAKFNKPLVWLMHDMWAFTGGCHYTQDCDRFMQSCGRCPQLKSQRERDLSRQVWQRKLRAWQGTNLTIVSPSQWMADCARSSSLFRDRRIEVIPHGMNTKAYKPIDRAVARHLLNLPSDRRLVLFGASSGVTSDTRKGFQFLQPALEQLSQSGWGDRLELVIFGIAKPENPPDLSFETHYLGRLQDDLTLAIVYAAADVMVVPSMQEAFGQTASEALACGTPVVAFAATGLKDIVDHQHNGYLANPFEVQDLAAGIAWVLSDDDRHAQLRQHARQKAEQEFTLERQAHRYQALFAELLAQT